MAEKANHPISPRLLSGAALLALVVGCFLVLQPFLTASLWAMILAYSTWPIYLHARRVLRGSANTAALAMMLMITLLLLAPLAIVGLSLADNAATLTELLRQRIEAGTPAAPDWLGQLPLIGERATAYWNDLTHDSGRLLEEAKKALPALKAFLFASGATIGQGVMQITLSILIAFFFYRDGEVAARRLDAAVGRIGGAHGQHLLRVGAGTVRGVVYGILGTALGQALLAGIGFWVAGVPAPTLLGLVTFFLSPIPMGPVILWLPAAGWLLYQGATGWAIFMALWGMLVVSSVDNFLKPFLISRGSSLPVLFVFLGVIGGAAAFGFIGVFLGPTLLAVGYCLMQEWAVVAPEASEPKDPQAS
jgi:predicted PurR-regulated permease PerM